MLQRQPYLCKENTMLTIPEPVLYIIITASNLGKITSFRADLILRRTSVTVVLPAEFYNWHSCWNLNTLLSQGLQHHLSCIREIGISILPTSYVKVADGPCIRDRFTQDKSLRVIGPYWFTLSRAPRINILIACTKFKSCAKQATWKVSYRLSVVAKSKASIFLSYPSRRIR